MERTLADLLAGLDARQCETHLILKAPLEMEARLRAALPKDVAIHVPRLFAVQDWQDALAEMKVPAPVRFLGRLGLRVLRDLSFLADIILLRFHIGRLHPDALQVVNGGYPGGRVCLAALVAARAAGVPSIDMYVLSHPQTIKFGDRLLDRLAAASTDRVTSNSRAASAGFAERGMPAEKLRTVHTGLAPDAGAAAASWRESDAQTIAGMVAVFVESKGHRFLLEAAARLAPRYPRLKWVCVGDGPAREEIAARARELGLEKRVLFPGAMSGAEAIAGFDVLVHPSLHEGFPNVVLEGMRAGKPVVATRIAGIPEQIEDGVSGLLVPPGDAAAFAQAVARLLDDPASARRIGEAGRSRFLENFTIDRMRRDFFSPLGLNERA